MCLIAIALGVSERFPLVIAGNRDESLTRPTLPLDWWRSPRGTAILGGRDVEGGGTWMGITPGGRFAMLTNVRNPSASSPAEPKSRGSLVVDWLDSALDAKAWGSRYDARRFNGFNLIAGNWAQQQCDYLSHPLFFKRNEALAGMNTASNAIELVVDTMPVGQVYGLSNAALNTPWPKTLRLKLALQSALHAPDANLLTQALIEALQHAEPAADDVLPHTGVPRDLELALSSAYVSHPPDAPRYGTRTSWVAVLEHNADAPAQLMLTEITHAHRGQSPIAAPLRQQSLSWPKN